jgi:hypothetical protein
MNTTGKGIQMNGYISGPFQVVLGTHLFTVEIDVAPIEEDMLLVFRWAPRSNTPPRHRPILPPFPLLHSDRIG